MVKRINLIGFLAITIFTILLIISYNHGRQQQQQHSVHYTDLIDAVLIERNRSFLNQQQRELIRKQQAIIEHETNDYQFPYNQQLPQFQMSQNGKPIRSIILTTWRSGSTFLGDVLNAVPGNYYHYEPLLDYGIIQIRGAPYADRALSVIKMLLECRYDDLERYLEYGKTHEYLFMHNTRLWMQCVDANSCWDAKFLNEFCQLFPVQSMKVVRLRLKLAEELLKDEALNVKVLLMVRDPRGTLQSRKHRDWCPGQPDCDNPSLLCADMVSDYSAAVQLQSKYPNTFRAIRYEDLSLQPFEMVKELFAYFGLDFHPNVRMFLDSHTKLNLGGVSSTFRDSKSAPFHWRTDLNLSEIYYIQDNCDEAMKLWGYVHYKQHQQPNVKEFNPLTSYAIA